MVAPAGACYPEPVRGVGVVVVAVLAGGCGRVGFDTLGGADAGATSDAAVDTSDGSGDAGLVRQTWSLGEIPGATVQGVTSDTWMCDGRNDQDLNWGASSRFEGGNTCTGLVRFDLAALPAGAIIVDASLEVWPLLVPSVRGQVDVHRVTEAWVEGSLDGLPGESNYVRRMPGVDWSTRGAEPPGSADPDILHSFDPARFEAQIIPLPPEVVQGWAGDPGTNHGLGFYGSGWGDPDSQHPHFVSSEGTPENQRPVLRVTFDSP